MSAAPPEIRTNSVGVRIDGATILDGVRVVAPAGMLTTIVGPNGSGKSTLLRTIYRACRPSSGVAMIGEKDVWKLRAKENARLRAVVTQHHGETAEFTVREIVEMGRAPHKGYLEKETAADVKLVEQGLEDVGMGAFADRHFQDLSGGERQRVLLARALAQRAPAILLDEPTNHLDIRAQLTLMDILRGLDATILMAVHDLNQALTYSDRVIMMSGGETVADGDPHEVIEPGRLATVFGVESELVESPLSGRRQLLFGAPGCRPGTPVAAHPTVIPDDDRCGGQRNRDEDRP